MIYIYLFHFSSILAFKAFLFRPGLCGFLLAVGKKKKKIKIHQLMCRLVMK